MSMLLPHRFKKIGAIIFPIGLTLWIIMQYRYLHQFIDYLGLTHYVFQPNGFSWYITIVGVLSFFSFLFGLYFFIFSKEKVEDEWVKQVRTDSFQIAAIVELIFVIIFFVTITIFPDFEKLIDDLQLTLFFMGALVVFWIAYIVRFNYVIYIKANGYEE